ncbi:hypothetical protein GEMRC1_013300 [Eukaryota sp. GEM-RC1]
MELRDDDCLKEFVNSFTATKSIDFWPSFDQQELTSNRLYSNGLNYFKEKWPRINFKSALADFEKTAALNHAEAMFQSGHCYYLGLGTPKKSNKGSKLF